MSAPPPPPGLPTDPDSITKILEALKGQSRPASTNQPGIPGAMGGYGQPPPAAAYAMAYGAPPSYPPAPPQGQAGMDLGAIRPVNTGSLGLGGDDGGDPGRSYSAMPQYDGGRVGYGQHDRQDGRDFRRHSRSQSPPARRGGDPYRDNYNPYRDERREDRTYQSREYGQQQSQGRTYSPPEGRGRGGSSFRGGGARDRSPGRGGDDNSETIQIESGLVGLIIGRNGENLRRIEGETGCRVQFLNSDGGPMRQCKIAGPRARRNEVKASIDKIIGDTGTGGGGGGSRHSQERAPREQRGGAAALREGEDHMQIMVPDPTVGLIIGRGGETIRDLQERSGCHINIVGENKSINGLRPVNLIGSIEAAQKAKNLIMEIVDSDNRGEGSTSQDNPNVSSHNSNSNNNNSSNMNNSNNSKKPSYRGGDSGMGGRDHNSGPGGSMGGERLNDAILVPSEAVGMIIGKRGDTIKEIQNQTGCKINVAQSTGEGETEREIALIGSRDSIAQAKRAIEEKVDAVRQKGHGGPGGRDRPPRGQNDGYGGHSQGSAPPQSSAYAQAPAQAGQQPQLPAGTTADMYAPYGGYQAYLALWYQQYMKQANGGAGAAGAPPQPPSGGQ